MNRLPLFLALCLPGIVVAQSPTEPRIELSASGSESPSGTITDGEGPASVSGKIVLPPGWKLNIHVLTIRYAKDGGSRTLNTLLPVKGLEFSTTLNLKAGSYTVWAVIDVKDTQGRERQIKSESKTIEVK
jgi:hypothetical protein